MLKTITKTVVEEVKKPVAEEIYCDRCHKLIGRKRIDGFHHSDHHIVDYYTATTGHHDWGNDSVDSINENDYCPSCLYFAFNNYMSRSKGGNNTEYIDIEHKLMLSELAEEIGDE